MKRRCFAVFLGVFAVLILVSFTTEVEANSCVTCHRAPETVLSLPPYSAFHHAEWSVSIHSVEGVTCERCHGGDPTAEEKAAAHRNVKDSRDPASPIYYRNLPATCGTCHRDEYTHFVQSRHYENLKEDRLAPDCRTCHGSHDVSLINARVIAEKCKICHSRESGVQPQVALEAKQALSLMELIEDEREKVEGMVTLAEEKGKDVREAKDLLKDVEARLRQEGPRWHAFDITAFNKDLLEIWYAAKRSEELVSAALVERASAPPSPVTTPSPPREVCGPTAILLLSFPSLWGIRRRRR
jgi:hypothetical protein